MSEASERRKDRRVPVELWIEASAGDEMYYHRAANLSVGGAFFEKTIPEPVGKVIALRFTLPGSREEICCHGEIVSVQELAMGVRFVDLAQPDADRIRALVERSEPL